MKQFNSKLKNAKATFRVDHESRHASGLHESAHHRGSFFKLLKSYNLQQYAKEMTVRGFASEHEKLAKLTPLELKEFMEDIKVYPGHQTRMMALVHDLRHKKVQLVAGELLYDRERLPALGPPSHEPFRKQMSGVGSALVPKHRL